MATSDENTVTSSTDPRLPEFVDWLLGAVIALAGLMLIVAGSAIGLLIDEDVLVEEIEEGNITIMLFTTELTETETLTVVDAIVTWLGIGVLVTGFGLLIFAIGFIIMRHRAYRRVKSGAQISSYWSFAVLGGVATAILSFVPFSAAIGGAIAGYLERRDSSRAVSVGALAGLLPTLPLILLMVFLFGGIVSGMLSVGQNEMAMFFVAILLVSVMLVAIVGAGLGAIGGYVGGWFEENRATKE